MDAIPAIAAALRGVLAAGPGTVARADHEAPVPGCSRCDGPRVVLCLAGPHRLRVSGRPASQTLAPGEALLMPPGTWNRAEPGRRRRYISFTAQPDGLRAFMRWHDGRALNSSPSACALLPHQPPDDAALWRLALAAATAEERRALTTALLWRCLAALERPAPTTRPTAQRRWQAVAAWLVEQLPLLPGRAATAAHAGLHPAYLSQLCRDHAGCTFQDWCARQRLLHARTLLIAHPDLTVATVARLCGYGEPRHFRRQFRRHLGMTPGSCRSASPG